MISKIRAYSYQDEKIIQEISKAFEGNKRMYATIGRTGEGLKVGINNIISYSYFMVKKLRGIFVSKHQSTYLLFYRKSEFHFSFMDRLHYLYLAIFVIGIHRLKNVYLREQKIRRTRLEKIEQQNDEDYLYIWFLAQQPERKDLTGLVEAKNFIIQKAKETNLALYMETTDERLLKMYERCGFKFYDFLEDDAIDLRIWFGRFDPKA